MLQSMNKTTFALSHLLGQLFEKPDESSVITNGSMFRHAAASPLSGLLINLELSQQKNVPMDPYIQSALHNAYRLKELFALTHRDINKSKRKSFPLLPAINETVIFLRNRPGFSQVRHHLSLTPSTQLRGNRFLFQESLLCAINNAVESYHTHSRMKLVLVNARETARSVIISITDGGKGFTPWQKTLAFSDGFSTKPSNEGVGMSWIKRVIEQHLRGKITVHSKPNHGTSMIWVIPK